MSSSSLAALRANLAPLVAAATQSSSTARSAPAWTTRFAPSPTGYLHLGHVASALFVWGVGRALSARIILRIEDHDRERSRPQFEEAILRDLDWLGFEPDVGVESAAQPSAYRQSNHVERYEEHAQLLIDTGQVFSCTCSRRQLSAVAVEDASVELRYPGTCRPRGFTPGETSGWRTIQDEASIFYEDLVVGPQEQAPHRQAGDLLIRERGGNWTYQFAVTVDDLCEGVNLVVRGKDLLDSTGRQILLAKALGRVEPARFAHHPLQLEASGEKLSKRSSSTSIRHRKDLGASAADLIDEICVSLGLAPGYVRSPAAFARYLRNE